MKMIDMDRNWSSNPPIIYASDYSKKQQLETKHDQRK